MKNTSRKRSSDSLHFPVSEHHPAPPPPADPVAAIYAVVKLEELCCFGIGATPDQATEQARRWLPQNRALDVLPELPLLGSVPGAEGLFMAKVTPRLAEAVSAKGGASWLRFKVGDNGELDLSGDLPGDAMDRFEEGLERLRFQVETENAGIFARREVAKHGGCIGNSTVIPNG